MAHHFRGVSLEKEMKDLVERLRKQDCKTLLDAYDIMEAGSDEIERLTKIEQAALNLIAQKGRHNTEQAYKKLEEALK